MSLPWFRLYSEVLHDGKVQRLSPEVFKGWVNLLCLANETEPRGSLPRDAGDIAYALHLTDAETTKLITELHRVGLIDRKSGRLVMHKFDTRQKKSDDVSARVKKHRQNQKAGVPETAPETLQERPGNALDKIRGEEIQKREETEESERKNGDEAPPAHPFVVAFVKAHERRHARPPSPVAHAAALALEREFGADACISIATDFDWEKHPNYYRPRLLEERQRANDPAPVRVPARAGRGGTRPPGPSANAFRERFEAAKARGAAQEEQA